MKKHSNNFGLIRFLAAVQVLIVHGFNSVEQTFPGLNYLKMFPGVPVFFFISGFLIFQSYDRLKNKPLYVFFAHRIFRIFPALVFCTLLSVVSLYFIGYLQDNNIEVFELLVWVFSQITFMQFYNPEYFRNFGVGVVNGSLWTISVELQFYILIPLIALLVKTSRYRFILYALLIASIVTNVFLRLNPQQESMLAKLLYVSFLPWIYMFFFGVFVARMKSLQLLIERLPFSFIFVFFITTMYVILDVEHNSENGINPISYLLLACVIYRLAYSKLPFSTNFFNKTDMSYGMYLFHMPIINIMIYYNVDSLILYFTILYVSVIALSLISWKMIEKPSLNFVNSKVDKLQI